MPMTGTEIAPMADMNYKPEPLDTANVILSPDVYQLTELLAKNTHEVWARQRMSEGWTFGSQRDDTHKKHPCLVPYEELTDVEKEYDRKTALETLRMITALGYSLERKNDAPS